MESAASGIGKVSSHIFIEAHLIMRIRGPEPLQRPTAEMVLFQRGGTAVNDPVEKASAIQRLARHADELITNPKARLAAVSAAFLAIPGGIAASVVTGDPNISGVIATAITGVVYLPMTHKILKERQGMSPSILAYGADLIVDSTFTVVGFDVHSLPLILADLGCIVFSSPAIPLVLRQQLHAAREAKKAMKAELRHTESDRPTIFMRLKNLLSDPVARFYASAIVPLAIAVGTVVGSIAAHAPAYIPGTIGTVAAPFVYLSQSRRSAKLMKKEGLDTTTEGLSPATYAWDAAAQGNWLAYAAMKNIPTLIAVQLAIMAGWVYPFTLTIRKMVKNIKEKVIPERSLNRE